MRITRLASLCVVAFLCSFFSAAASAQPLARFVLPTNTAETAVQPTFRIVTSLPIDTTSVHWNWQIVDSTRVNAPILCVMPYDFYSTHSDSDWQSMAIRGTGSIIDDTTLEFQSNHLGNGMKCKAVLMDLRVISGNDTLTISDTVAQITFTTIPLPISLISLSCIDSGDLVRRHDTITAKFTRNLDSANSPVGQLLALSVLSTSYDSVQDTTISFDSIINTTQWLDPNDSSILHLLPTALFVLGQQYQLTTKLSRITGDTDQDVTYAFVCRKSFHLNIAAAPTGGLACLDTVHFDPVINENYWLINDTTMAPDTNFTGRRIQAGDTVRYTAPLRVGGAIFQKWSAPGGTGINNSTNPTATITRTADQLRDMNLFALYAPAPLDTISLAVSINGITNSDTNRVRVEVFSDTQYCRPKIKDTVRHAKTVLLVDGTRIILHATVLSDSLVFDHWISSDTTINNSHSPLIDVVPGHDLTATATYYNRAGGSLCGLQVNLDHDPTDPIALCDIAQIITPIGICDDQTLPCMPRCTTLVNPGTCPAVQVKIKIKDKNYGLASYSIDDVAANIHTTVNLIPYYWTKSGCDNPKDLYVATTDDYPCAGDGTFVPPQAIYTSTSTTQVTFTLRRLTRVLHVNLRTDDNQLPPSSSTRVTSDPTDRNILWCLALPKPIDIWLRTPRQGQTYYSHNLYYKAGESVSLQCDANQGYSFQQWEMGGVNTDWPSPLNQKSFTVKMDQDVTVTASYHAPFRLMRVSFLQATFANTGPLIVSKNIPVEEWGDIQTGLTGPPVWSSNDTMEMSVYFNKPVKVLEDISNGNDYSGSLCAGALYYFETSDPADRIRTFSILSPCRNESGSLIPINLRSDETDIYNIKSLRCIFRTYYQVPHYFRVWKNQDVQLAVGTSSLGSGMKSKSGETLANPQNLNFSTVSPDVYWYYVKTHVHDAHDFSKWWPIVGWFSEDNSDFVAWATKVKDGSGLISGWGQGCQQGNCEDEIDRIWASRAVSCSSHGDLLMMSSNGKDARSMAFFGTVLHVIAAKETSNGDKAACIADKLFEHKIPDNIESWNPDKLNDELRGQENTAEDECWQNHWDWWWHIYINNGPMYPEAGRAQIWGASKDYRAQHWVDDNGWSAHYIRVDLR